MTSELSLLCSSGNIGCPYSPTFPDTLRYNRKGVIRQNEINKHLSNVQPVKTLDNFPSQENNLPCAVPYLYHQQTSTGAPKQEIAGQQITFQKYFPKPGKYRTNAHYTGNSSCDLLYPIWNTGSDSTQPAVVTAKSSPPKQAAAYKLSSAHPYWAVPAGRTSGRKLPRAS